jgi:hypothetical protein
MTRGRGAIVTGAAAFDCDGLSTEVTPAAARGPCHGPARRGRDNG